VSGVQVHDARLATVMKAYGISRIVTLNVKDFARYSEIEAVHPEAFLVCAALGCRVRLDLEAA
jgi:hypothetical protein